MCPNRAPESGAAAAAWIESPVNQIFPSGNNIFSVGGLNVLNAAAPRVMKFAGVCVQHIVLSLRLGFGGLCRGFRCGFCRGLCRGFRCGLCRGFCRGFRCRFRRGFRCRLSRWISGGLSSWLGSGFCIGFSHRYRFCSDNRNLSVCRCGFSVRIGIASSNDHDAQKGNEIGSDFSSGGKRLAFGLSESFLDKPDRITPPADQKQTESEHVQKAEPLPAPIEFVATCPTEEQAQNQFCQAAFRIVHIVVSARGIACSGRARACLAGAAACAVLYERQPGSGNAGCGSGTAAGFPGIAESLSANAIADTGFA